MKRFDRRTFLALSDGFLLTAACGSGNDDDASPATTTASPTADGSGGPLVGRLRLGFFPNVTHAQPNVGIQNGAYASALGDGVDLDMTKTFNSGTTAIEALFAGEIDATYIGPSPAINGFVRSDGKEVRIISGESTPAPFSTRRPP